MGTKTAARVSALTIILNFALALMKFTFGFAAHSQALVSDAVNSASDVIKSTAVLFGVNLASKESDTSHPYGHERIESIFSLFLAVMLFATGAGIGISAIKLIINREEIVIPGSAALIAAVISIAVKEWMYRYTKRAATELKSMALLADAWDHRSDALSSIGSFIGIGGALLGIKILEPIASMVICAFIIKAAYNVLADAVNSLVDRACGDDELQKLRDTILNVAGVRSLDVLNTRRFGMKLYVDVEISADGSRTLYSAHEIAETVHREVERHFDDVKHCMVHVNPI